MSEVGRQFAQGVIWFQFAVMQVLAMGLMSTAFSEERRRRTLAILMSTPMTGWQIVTGKLLARLWQMMVLLACSLPVLMVVRVLGGVSWTYIATGLGATVANSILVASMTLYLALGPRRTHPTVIVIAACVAYGLFVGLPEQLLLALGPGSPLSQAARFLSPLFIFDQMNKAGASSVGINCAAHCAAVLGISALFLLAAGRRVRRVALDVLQQGDARARRRRKRPAAVSLRGAREAIRRVHGSPLIWKELRFYVPGGVSRANVLKVAILVGVLVMTYLFNLNFGIDFYEAQFIYMWLYFLPGIIVTAVLAGATLSAERESRALPLLLSLPVSDGHIIFAKVLGVFFRAMPAWILMVVHLLVFSALGFIHPVILLQMAMLIVWVTVFLTGTGLYFGSRFRSGTAAAVMNIGLVIGLWIVLASLVGAWMSGPCVEESDLYSNMFYGNPFIQMAVVTSTAARAAAEDAGAKVLIGSPTVLGLGTATGMMFISMLGYGALGLAFAWSAKRRLRVSLFRD